MSTIDPSAVAINAAGIADALRMCQVVDSDGANRIDHLTEEFQGWCGVMACVAEAGKIMEQYRARRGSTSAWGGDLPYLYDVWESIARALWESLGIGDLERMVRGAIEAAESHDAE